MTVEASEAEKRTGTLANLASYTTKATRVTQPTVIMAIISGLCHVLVARLVRVRGRRRRVHPAAKRSRPKRSRSANEV